MYRLSCRSEADWSQLRLGTVLMARHVPRLRTEAKLTQRVQMRVQGCDVVVPDIASRLDGRKVPCVTEISHLQSRFSGAEG